MQCAPIKKNRECNDMKWILESVQCFQTLERSSTKQDARYIPGDFPPYQTNHAEARFEPFIY